VLQHPKWSLNPMLRIRDSVLEPLRITGAALEAAAGRARAGAALEAVSLPGNYQDRFPHELSGGQRQRVSIARALITQPEFVLFDEAVSALDVSVQAQILNLIKSLQITQGFSAIFISHDLAATRYVANRIAVLHAGRLVEDADAGLFYGLASHPYSRGLQFASGLVADPVHELSLGKPGLPPEGCALAPRCPRAMERCRLTLPALKGPEGHRVACLEAETE
jgi:oligopeptide/dipeptide ABC transporter ATP-binding protein